MITLTPEQLHEAVREAANRFDGCGCAQCRAEIDAYAADVVRRLVAEQPKAELCVYCATGAHSKCMSGCDCPPEDGIPALHPITTRVRKLGGGFIGDDEEGQS
jgi:hypothetical protein